MNLDWEFNHPFSGFERFGRPVDFRALEPDLKLLWQVPLAYLEAALTPARISAAEPDTPLDVTLAYIDHSSFNAGIRHAKNSVSACLFAGVPLIAFKACRLLAARLDLHSGLPFCDKNKRLIKFSKQLKIEHNWPISDEPARQASSDLRLFEASAPRKNIELGTFLFDIAMRYVAMHEAMHFVLGHAAYCQSELGLDSFADADENRRELNPLVSQTLEFIADRHTLHGVLTDLTQGRLFHEWCAEPPLKVIDTDLETWFRRLTIAVLALISTIWLGHARQNFADFSKPYPHPYERLFWMVCGLQEMTKGSFEDDIDLCFGLNTFTLESNFEIPGTFLKLISQDLLIGRETGTSPLDHSYAAVKAKAIEIQTHLYKNYGPFYPTF